jgi:hypothetical protein
MVLNMLLVATAALPLFLGVRAATGMAAAVAPYYKAPSPAQYSAEAPIVSGEEYGLPHHWRQLPAAELMDALQKLYRANTADALSTKGQHSTICTPDNIIVRREW